MSRRTQSAHRPMRTTLVAALVALTAGLAPSPASAAERLETIDVPSTKGYIDLSQTRLNKATSLKANVLLPDGYDTEAGKAWPVLYLLAGVGDNAGAWIDPEKGNLQKLAKGFPGIIVMPESGRGYFTDWWRGGNRVGSQWERYYFEEVIPAIESRYRIRPGRQNRAIGGISMGGYAGILYVGQFPSYFGTAISMSGLLDSQAPEVVSVLPIDIGSPYTRIWGKSNGPFATTHNPMKMVENTVGSRVYLSTGNGTPSARYPFNFSAWTSGSVAERSTRVQALRWAARGRALGVDVEYRGHTGVHDWPYWRAELPRLIDWNPFGAVPVTDPAANTTWTYRTMAPRGNAWGFGYRFTAPTTDIFMFKRAGQVLSGTGKGTVTITPGAAETDATGTGAKTACAFTATLPFEHTLPAGC